MLCDQRSDLQNFTRVRFKYGQFVYTFGNSFEKGEEAENAPGSGPVKFRLLNVPFSTYLTINRLNDPLGHYRPAEIAFVVREFAFKHDFISRREYEDKEPDFDDFKGRSITDEDLASPGVDGRLAFLVMLERGFLLGRNRKLTDKLTEEDLHALQLECRGSLLGQSWHLYAVIMLCSVGAAIQGWDQVGTAAANITWPEQFGLLPWYKRGPEDFSQGSFHDAWIVGIVNSVPYFVSPIGCLLSDPMNNWFGRLQTIFIAAIFCFTSVFGCAFTRPPYYGELVACRSLLGIGMGLKASTVPLLASEAAPPRIRGSLVMQCQVNVALGIFLGSLANLIIYLCRFKDPWRYQLGCALIPAVPVMVAVWFIPDSPVWLLRKGDVKGAYNALRKLRSRPVIACRDLLVMYYASQIERECMDIPVAKGPDRWHQRMLLRRYIHRMKELFTVKRNRRATLSSLIVMISQALCGINIIVFYCNTLFLGNGSLDKPSESIEQGTDIVPALCMSLGFGFCNFLFALPAVKTIDRFGRLSLLLVTFPIMGLWLLGLSLSFIRSNDVTADKVVCIIFFTIFYSPGEGPIPFTYAAEVFPATHRDVGMALSVSTNLFFAGVLTVFFPALQTHWSPAKAIGLFAGLNIVAFVLIWLLVIETKQLPLEVLTERFSHSTRDLIRRRLYLACPKAWLIKRRSDASDLEQYASTPETSSSEVHEIRESKIS